MMLILFYLCFTDEETEATDLPKVTQLIVLDMGFKYISSP